MFEHLTFLSKLAYQSLLTPAGPFFTENDYPDLTGQKWLVTGSTGGIGLEVSKQLIAQHAEVWLVGRSVQKLDNAVATLKKQFPSASGIHTVVIDYMDLTTVKPAVEKLKHETKQLNGIVHNAGVMFAPQTSRTAQGFEETVGVNNLATQLLQDLLDPFILHVPNARIVWLSSMGHIFAPTDGFDVRSVDSNSTFVRYALSKALDYIMAVQWTKKHPEATNVKSIAVHPGIIRSDLSRHMQPWQVKIMSLFQYDTKHGALPVIYAALCPIAKNNDYIIPFGRPGLVRPDVYAAARDERGAAALAWVESKIDLYK